MDKYNKQKQAKIKIVPSSPRADGFGYSWPFERRKIAHKLSFYLLFEAIQIFLRGQDIGVPQWLLDKFGADAGTL